MGLGWRLGEGYVRSEEITQGVILFYYFDSGGVGYLGVFDDLDTALSVRSGVGDCGGGVVFPDQIQMFVDGKEHG